MKILFTVRPEIFSVMIMIFLIQYDIYCARFRNGRNDFSRFAVVCLAHCVMALVTEITVNLPGTPKLLNDLCHILFFTTSLLYSLFYFEYAVRQVLAKEPLRKKILSSARILCIIFIVIMICAPISYVHGTYTDYSAGIGPTLCYALGFVFFLTADILFIINRKHIDSVLCTLVLPLSLITLGLLVVQIVLSEFLFTAQALTLTAVGLFFVIENPVGKFKDQAFIDHNTQVWNRNGYEYDLENRLPVRLKNSTSFTYLMADINGLKAVNDTLGHLEGDRLIEQTARILQRELPSAHKLYRVGGDEFVALYFDQAPEVIEREAKNASKKCSEIRLSKDFPTGISVGYARRQDDEAVADIAKRAEHMMYEAKRAYYSSRGADRRKPD